MGSPDFLSSVTAISPPAAPAHPTGGGGTFCVRLGMYVSPRVKILGAGEFFLLNLRPADGC